MTRTKEQPVSNVLVVDDEPMVCRTIARCLEEHDVRSCTEPVEALEILMQLDFHLVLCDIMMPDLNGLELYERVVEERPRLTDRFIFISGGAMGQALRSRVATLPRPLIKKPFDLIEFRNIIGAHLDEVHG